MILIEYNGYRELIFIIISGILLFILGILFLIIAIFTNFFNKNGFIIDENGITRIFFNKKYLIRWEHIISYSITGDIKRNDCYINFQTEKSIKYKNILKSKNAVSISTKLLKNITLNELIEEINSIKM
jgi:hypothetical protein